MSTLKNGGRAALKVSHINVANGKGRTSSIAYLQQSVSVNPRHRQTRPASLAHAAGFGFTSACRDIKPVSIKLPFQQSGIRARVSEQGKSRSIATSSSFLMAKKVLILLINISNNIKQGGMAAGTLNLSGTLDASAPNGGNGGFIETTAATAGLAGNWLINRVHDCRCRRGYRRSDAGRRPRKRQRWLERQMSACLEKPESAP